MGVCRRRLLSLISTRPFHDIEAHELRRLALRHIYAHYLGRLFDVPHIAHREAVQTDENELYCTNICAMRHTSTTVDALTFIQQESAAGSLFCESCQKDLVAQIAASHFGMN
jgi:hypothetical protein